MHSTESSRTHRHVVDLFEAMARFGGVARRRELLGLTSVHTVDNAIRRGRLIVVLPGIVIDGWLIDERTVWLRALDIYLAGRGAVSHSTAMALWGLGDPPAIDHVTVSRGVRLVRSQRLIPHESTTFPPEGGYVTRRAGIATIDLDTALIAAWASMVDDERRAAVVIGVRDRFTTPARLRRRLLAQPKLAGRQQLLQLCAHVADGAQSEFELWGLDHLFDDRLLAWSTGQHPLRLGNRTIYLDRACIAEKVDFELDGTRWHDRHPEQRERDRRRDEQLARLGWLTVRISYARAVGDPADVTAGMHQTLEVRGAQLGLPSSAPMCEGLRLDAPAKEA